MTNASRSRRPWIVLASLPAIAAMTLTGLTSGTGPAAAGSARPAAAGASPWTKVSAQLVDSLASPTMLRDTGGLHVVYPVEPTSSTSAYEHVALDPTGHAISHSTVVSASGLVMNPVLLPRAGATMRLVFSGLQVGPGALGEGRMMETVSADGGATWALQNRVLTKSSSAYAGYGTGATVLANDTVISANILNFRVGAIESIDSTVINAAPDDQQLPQPSCCQYETTLVNSGGNVYAAWYSNGTGPETGVFVQQIYPTIGTRMKVPDSGNGAGGSSNGEQRTAIGVRPDGSVVVAYTVGYPTATSVALWQVGSSTYTKVPHSAGAEATALSVAPSGALWIAWQGSSKSSDDSFVAVAPAGSLQAGEPMPQGRPNADTFPVYIGVDATGTTPLMMYVDGTPQALYTRPVGYPLTVKVQGAAKLRRAKTATLKFKVTSNGVNVSRAKVRLVAPGDKATCKTNSAGTCALKIRPTKAGKAKLTVSRSGYPTYTTRLRVKT